MVSPQRGVRRRPSPPDDARGPAPRGHWLDALAAEQSTVFGCEVSPYLAFGIAGSAIGFAVLCGLVLVSRLPIAFAVILLTASVATFIAAGLARKAIAGTERHILLQDVLLVLAASGLVAWSVRQPVLPTLDLMVAGLGTFLCLGRVGCFRSGCCHGRPSRFGACSLAEGPLRGIRLFPLQLVEAGWIFAVTVVGIALVLARAEPGTAVSWWLLAYGAGRFVLELARGDAARARLGPMSEAQWTFVALVLARVAYEYATTDLPPATLVAFAVSLAIVPLGWITRSWWLNLPRDPLTLEQIDRWQALLGDLERAARAAGTAGCGQDGLELQLAVDRADGALEVHAYSIGQQGEAKDEPLAFALAGVILQRMPAFQLLRADVCEHGRLHVWACLDPRDERRSIDTDPPFEVRLRAQAFTRSLRAWAARRSQVPEGPAAAARPELLPPPEPVPEPLRGRSWSFAELPVYSRDELRRG